MDLFAKYQTEHDPVYQLVENENNSRYASFLITMIKSAIDSGQNWLTEDLIKAFNFHAIVALHPEAGQYRQTQVEVGNHLPPHADEVPDLMKQMVAEVNQRWDVWPSTRLAAHALWQINYIHPFRNGNGRAARAACYFIICVKVGGLLPGSSTLPTILQHEPVRAEYVDALKTADKGNLDPLISLIERVLTQQLA